MDKLLETVDLDMEESNELAFKVKVEGAAGNSAKVRLVCEDKNVSFMFEGTGTGEEGVVQFTIPRMVDKLLEGTYPARVEVLIENRYFAPVLFQIAFKKPMKVVAEAVIPKKRSAEVSVSASPVRVVQLQRVVEAKPVVEKKSLTLEERFEGKHIKLRKQT
jgi:hypothetical protein